MTEIDRLKARGITVGPENLRISERTQVIMPYHQRLDLAREGPRAPARSAPPAGASAPVTKTRWPAGASGWRTWSTPRSSRPSWRRCCPEKNFYLEKFLEDQPFTLEEILTPYSGDGQTPDTPGGQRLGPPRPRRVRHGHNILFEGAQGTHLDIDHGTYPYVTSSNPVAGGRLHRRRRSGPTQLHQVLGIVKAYTTRVGGGPFPTECLDEIGDHLVECGVEFGSTTGRRRRCGWLDTVVLKDSARLNGLTGLAITKLDVLDTLNPVKICVAYEVDGVRRETIPATIKDLERCRPVFEELPGWQEDIREVRRFEDLPAATQELSETAGRTGGRAHPDRLRGPGPGRDHCGPESVSIDSQSIGGAAAARRRQTWLEPPRAAVLPFTGC